MKQVFDGLEAVPPAGGLAAVTGVSAETNLWTPTLWTPLAAQYATAPQKFELEAWGIATAPVTTPGTLALTARIGTSATPASNTILGAASTATQLTTQTNLPWFLKGTLTIRSIGIPGANSTVHFQGCFWSPVLIAAATAPCIMFGSTTAAASVDLSIAQALAISVTPSVTGQSYQPHHIAWRSLN